MRASLWCTVLLAVGAVIAQPPTNGPPGYEWAYLQGKGGTNEKFLKEIDAAQKGTGSNLVVYGDSILQCLRFEDGVCNGAIAVGEKRFGNYNPLMFAVGGETPDALMGRLLDGVVPKELGKNGDTAVVIMIGHNQLTQNGPNKTADKINAIVNYVLEADPSNQVISMALLPATGGDRQYVRGQMYPPQQQLAQRLQQMASSEKRVHFADCVPAFLDPKDKTMSHPDLIPDGTHLSAEGFERLADCLDPFLEKVTGMKTVASSTSSNTTSATSGNTTTATSNSSSSSNATGTSGGITASSSDGGYPTPTFAGWEADDYGSTVAKPSASSSTSTSSASTSSSTSASETSSNIAGVMKPGVQGVQGAMGSWEAQEVAGSVAAVAATDEDGEDDDWQQQQLEQGEQQGSKPSTSDVLSYIQSLPKVALPTASTGGVAGRRRLLWRWV